MLRLPSGLNEENGDVGADGCEGLDGAGGESGREASRPDDGGGPNRILTNPFGV